MKIEIAQSAATQWGRRTHLGVTHCTGGRLGWLHGSWGRKRPHGGLPGRSHNLILTVKPVVAQLGNPDIKYILRFDLWRYKISLELRRWPLSCQGCNDNIDASCWCYLQVIDVLLSVQVNATGPFLDGHDGEANVDATMKFAFLDLRQANKTYLLTLINTL